MDHVEEKPEVLSYKKVSSLIDQNQSFLVMDCICKKEQGESEISCNQLFQMSLDMASKPDSCADTVPRKHHQLQMCLATAPKPGFFNHDVRGRVLTKDEAYALLNKTESFGLVHIAAKTREEVVYVCNCCGCCCGILIAISRSGVPASQVINTRDCAAIDSDSCTGCSLCVQRCQLKAIDLGQETYHIIENRCIGCGLCVTACPTDAVALVPTKQECNARLPERKSNMFVSTIRKLIFEHLP
jgi:Na+-translocating ferredoxin:NAD+ oxidoreductase subunit B